MTVAVSLQLDAIAAHVMQQLGDKIVSQEFVAGEYILTVLPENLEAVLTFLKDDEHCLFKQLVDLCGVDYPSRVSRFDVVYNLLSLHKNERIRVKVEADEDTIVPSVIAIHSTAGWFEREAWDLYGIKFGGNPDLRRILTDYGFEGHPLRKDFPLTGYVEVRYDETRKQVVYEPVSLPQDFRNFDNLSPWEGAHYILPNELKGDEKAEKTA